jgi:uncharacterized membrane protein
MVVPAGVALPAPPERFSYSQERYGAPARRHSRTLEPMSPQKAYRLALVMIPLSLAVGIIAAIGGVWLVVIIMALNLVFQAINFRASRRALRNRN